MQPIQVLGVALIPLACFAYLGELAWSQEEVRPNSPVQRSRVPNSINGATVPNPQFQAGGPRGAGAGGSSASEAALFPAEFRTIDGRDNNLHHAKWGAADVPFRRRVLSRYSDGHDAPSGANRPNARVISNGVCDQSASIPNPQGVSDYVWVWGQFLDHDITETPLADPGEPFDITVPLGDPEFDPFGQGGQTIPLNRSSYDHIQGRREQVNEITAYIDGSQIYGSDRARAQALRTLDGTGRMKTSAGDLLPYNVDGFPNTPNNSAAFFFAGDIRANEQVLLTAMHTLFVREHNHWAAVLQGLRPLDGEATYQWARAIVVAELQAITYREFLPVVLGPQAMDPHHGYRRNVDASIANGFAAAAYRFGHTMLSPSLRRVDATGATVPDGDLSLAEAFNRPDRIVSDGLEPYLRGAAVQLAQRLDVQIVDEVRNLLFGPPGSGGLDLAALNLQRGRDHGLPDFLRLRQGYGLPPLNSFMQLTGNAEVAQKLQRTYGSMNRLDPWIGLLSEQVEPGALVGRTLQRVLAEQFQALREGDRFYYESYMSERIQFLVESQTLSRIIQRNTDIGSELSPDVFRVQ